MKYNLLIVLILTIGFTFLWKGGNKIYKKEIIEISNIIEKCFESAILIDITQRVDETGMPHHSGIINGPPSPNITLTTEDTTIVIPKKGRDYIENAEQKRNRFFQTIMIIENPPRASLLDSLFQKVLNENNIYGKTAIKYTLKESNTTTYSCDSTRLRSYDTSEERLLGLMDEISVQYFIKVSLFSALMNNKKQSLILFFTWLILTALFIGIVEIKRRKDIQKTFTYDPPEILFYISNTLSFDAEKGTIYYGENESLQLTDQLAKLFLCFLQSSNYFLSIEKMEDIMRGDIMAGRSWRNQIIKRLRDTLKPVSEIKIENIRGIGYQLVCENSTPLPEDKKIKNEQIRNKLNGES